MALWKNKASGSDAGSLAGGVADDVAAGETSPSRSIAFRKALVVASWLLVVAWAGVIFFMSSNTSTGLNEGLGVFSRLFQCLKGVQAAVLGTGVDLLSSLAHFCEYAVFGALWVNALRHHVSLRVAVLLGVACASAYGVTDEFHQLFVEGRMCDPVDWLVDTAGAAVGALLAWWVALRCQRRAGR